MYFLISFPLMLVLMGCLWHAYKMFYWGTITSKQWLSIRTMGWVGVAASLLSDLKLVSVGRPYLLALCALALLGVAILMIRLPRPSSKGSNS